MSAAQLPEGWRNLPWKKLAIEIKDQVAEDNVFQGAAALAFYAMLSIFPLLIFLLSVVAYFPMDGLESAIMDFLHDAMPGGAADLLEGTVQRTVAKQQPNLLSLGIIGTLWAATAGMYAAMLQLNRTYRVEEGRPFLKARGTSLLLTLCFGLLVLVAFLMIVLGGWLESWMINAVGFTETVAATFSALRWIVILGFLLLGFALVYYLGPNVDQKFKWVSPGAVVGTALLVAASIGFRIYVTNFGNYEATYGALGTVIVLMLWLYVSGLVLLLGSEINVAVEKHVAPGSPRATGEPGA